MARHLLMSSTDRKDYKEAAMGRDGTEVPYGAPDLMVLKKPECLGPQPGCGIARRLGYVAEGRLTRNRITLDVQVYEELPG
jgi:hypothetical protein